MQQISALERLQGLVASVWQPANTEANHRRQLRGGYGGGSTTVGLCLPDVCDATDVKVGRVPHFSGNPCSQV